MRTQLARFLLHVASKLAKESTLCSTKGKWKFQREWMAEPYPPVRGVSTVGQIHSEGNGNA